MNQLSGGRCVQDVCRENIESLKAIWFNYVQLRRCGVYICMAIALSCGTYIIKLRLRFYEGNETAVYVRHNCVNPILNCMCTTHQPDFSDILVALREWTSPLCCRRPAAACPRKEIEYPLNN